MLRAGNQPLDGKIAVGNVVLNRVASPRFPNSVYEVIFQRNQFTPAANGSINRTPSAESVVAAKLCLDGANTAGSALYFVNPTVAPGWASRNRPYVATIGAHALQVGAAKPRPLVSAFCVCLQQNDHLVAICLLS